MYKIIVCDLDETLISRDRTISRENIEAIRKATEAGVKFVPCTGRGYNSVHNTTSQLGLFDQKDQYVISYNGGAITENKDEKQLYFQGITFEEAEAIVNCFKKMKFMAPPSNGLIPIGSEQIEKGMKQILKPEFIATLTRKPVTYGGGVSFIIEAGIAYGGDSGRVVNEQRKSVIIRLKL